MYASKADARDKLFAYCVVVYATRRQNVYEAKTVGLNVNLK